MRVLSVPTRRLVTERGMEAWYPSHECPQPEGHMASYIGRREFLATLGGAAAAWPLTARAQQKEHVRRVGVHMHTSAGEPETQARLAAFVQGLQEAGWLVGRNVQVETR